MENKIYNAAFGNSQAAFVLYEILKQNKKLSKRVTNLIVTFNTQLNALELVDTRVSLGIANILLKVTIGNCKKLPENVRSFSQNVVKARFRKFVCRTNGYLPTEKRVEFLKLKK